MLVNVNGKERIALADDFQDITLTLTPIEWSELKDLFEYQKKVTPSVFSKSTKTIYRKLIENTPKLKEGVVEVKNDSI